MASPLLSHARAQRLLESSRGLPILVAGDLMLDVGVFGDVERVSPEAPVPVVRVRRESASPGGDRKSVV